MSNNGDPASSFEDALIKKLLLPLALIAMIVGALRDVVFPYILFNFSSFIYIGIFAWSILRPPRNPVLKVVFAVIIIPFTILGLLILLATWNKGLEPALSNAFRPFATFFQIVPLPFSVFARFLQPDELAIGAFVGLSLLSLLRLGNVRLLAAVVVLTVLAVGGVFVGGQFTPTTQEAVRPTASAPSGPPAAVAQRPARAPVAPTASTAGANNALRIQAFDTSWDSTEYCVMCSIPNWTEPQQPGQYEWRTSYPADKPILLRFGWCARDKQTLDANWTKMAYGLSVDDQRVDLSQLLQKEQTVKESVCRFYAGLLSGWPTGPHAYVWTHTIQTELHDGWATYQPGEYSLKFLVDVR